MLEFGDKVVGKVTVELELTENDISIIIVNGFEGGISYWACLDSHTNSHWLEDKPKGEPISTWATKALIEGKPIILYDRENPEETAELTLEKLIEGFKKNYIERPHDNDLEAGDATTVDCIIQYALFGQVVYG